MLTHSMFVSLFPNWIGQTQPRAVKTDGSTLHLGTTAPIQSRGKTVNAVAPGAVAGDRLERVLRGRADDSGRSLEDVTADALSIQSIERFVDPDDIAALCIFLASDAAKSISGQTIPIDGDSKAAQ
jgi:NAD(P)-dependent dehydrogenase (short-subunit alcohol dehydrogenase family)